MEGEVVGASVEVEIVGFSMEGEIEVEVAAESFGW